jgi:hypothetical protein
MLYLLYYEAYINEDKTIKIVHLIHWIRLVKRPENAILIWQGFNCAFSGGKGEVYYVQTSSKKS